MIASFFCPDDLPYPRRIGTATAKPCFTNTSLWRQNRLRNLISASSDFSKGTPWLMITSGKGPGPSGLYTVVWSRATPPMTSMGTQTIRSLRNRASFPGPGDAGACPAVHPAMVATMFASRPKKPCLVRDKQGLLSLSGGPPEKGTNVKAYRSATSLASMKGAPSQPSAPVVEHQDRYFHDGVVVGMHLTAVDPRPV